MVFFYALLISPVLWIISLVFLKKWKHFKRFVFINTSILLAYLLVIVNANLPAFANDNFGWKRFFFATAIVMAHIILGFLFALGFYIKKKRLKAHSLH